MAHIRSRFGQDLSTQAGATIAALIDAAKPYVAAVLIVTVLLSIWVALRGT